MSDPSGLKRKADHGVDNLHVAESIKRNKYYANTINQPYEATSDQAREFNHLLFNLIQFKKEHGSFQVPKEQFPELHKWMQTLKRDYENYSTDPSTSNLTRDQLKVLEFLHVPLSSRGDEQWNHFYELLRQYGDRHNHILVPPQCEVPGLSEWVADQREQYKAWKHGQASQLTDERRDKMDAIGFAWSVRSRPEWDQHYQDLLAYKEKHGNCNVPQQYKPNKSLGKWVAKQREQYKRLQRGQHSCLTPYRVEKLVKAEFAWQVRSSVREMAAAAVTAEDELNPIKLEMERTQEDQQQDHEHQQQQDDPQSDNAPTAEFVAGSVPDQAHQGDDEHVGEVLDV